MSTCLLMMIAGLALILPGLVYGLATAARGPLTRLWGASGRLAAYFPARSLLHGSTIEMLAQDSN